MNFLVAGTILAIVLASVVALHRWLERPRFTCWTSTIMGDGETGAIFCPDCSRQRIVRDGVRSVEPFRTTPIGHSCSRCGKEAR